MRMRPAGFLLLVPIVGAAVFAMFHSPSSSATDSDQPVTVTTTQTTAGQPFDQSAGVADDLHAGKLPPGHPPIDPSGATGSGAASMDPQPDTEDASLKWTVPTTWKTVPGTSTMRIATYEIPLSGGDTDHPQLTVVRAGGTAEANAQRWVGQFDNAGKDTRTVKLVRDLTVTIAEVSGTYLGGGMMANAANQTHEHWALVGAIVGTKGSPYFFKMVGPAASVKAAHPAFDALIASLTPS